MSMKKLAILSAVHNYGGLNGTEMHPTPGSPPAPVHGINVMLGGAMLSGIILIVFIFCYCCHKTNRKTQTNLPITYWNSNSEHGLSMEIYTVDSQNQQCIDLQQDFTSSDDNNYHRPATPGPPPSYDAIVSLVNNNNSNSSNNKKKFDDNDDETGGLPTYEDAVQLRVTGNGYV